MQDPDRRQLGVAAALALVLLVGPVAQPALAQQPQDDLPYQPPNPPAVLDNVLFEKTQELNESLNRAQERLGPDPDLRTARQELDAARTYGRTGDLHLLMQRLSNVPVLINKVRWESGSSSSLHDRTEALVGETREDVGSLHRKFGNVTETSTDTYLLDDLLISSGLLARGQTFLMTYETFDQKWENGTRDQRVRQGLIAWSSGASFFVDIADRVAARALETASGDARGLVVSQQAIEGVYVDWSRQVQNLSISIDKSYPRILDENTREHRYLAALGALLEWTRQQPIAAGQQRQQMESGLTVEDAWATLNRSIHREDLFDSLEGTQVPTSTLRLGLRAALQEYQTAREDIRTNKSTQGLITGISQGLGWVAYSRLAANIHLDLMGKAPLEPLLWFPGDEVAPAGTDGSTDGSTDGGDGGSSIGWLPIGIGALAVGMSALVYARVRRGGEP